MLLLLMLRRPLLMLLLATAGPTAGAGLLVLLLLLLLLLGLAATWLLPGGVRPSFPLTDQELDRGVVVRGFLIRRGVGRGWGGTEVREILIRPVGFVGVESGGGSGIASFADSGCLAPPARPRAVEDRGGDQGGCEDAEAEEPRRLQGLPSSPAGSRSRPSQGVG